MKYNLKVTTFEDEYVSVVRASRPGALKSVAGKMFHTAEVKKVLVFDTNGKVYLKLEKTDVECVRYERI